MTQCFSAIVSLSVRGLTHRVFVLSVRESELHVTAGLACAYTYDNNDSNYAKGQR